MTDGTSKCK